MDSTPAPQARQLRLLSVVTPMRNEEGVVDAFYARVREVLEDLPFELIIVDDGSTDSTTAALEKLAASDPRVRVVLLSRGFGHQAAITAGLDHARGDAVVMIDGDLQDPPEVILQMLDRWREGIDVVYAVREARPGETRFKLATARLFYSVFDRLAQIKLEHNAGDFRLLDRRALDALLSMRERSRFLRGMTVWIGFSQTAVPYRRDERFAGETKYSLTKMVRLALDGVASFSYVPMRLATTLGFLFSLAAFIAIPIIIALKIGDQNVPGVTEIIVVVLLLGGIQLMTIGVVGEYVSRVFDEVKGRPLYVVRGRLNVTEPPAEAAADAATEAGVSP